MTAPGCLMFHSHLQTLQRIRCEPRLLFSSASLSTLIYQLSYREKQHLHDATPAARAQLVGFTICRKAAHAVQRFSPTCRLVPQPPAVDARLPELPCNLHHQMQSARVFNEAWFYKRTVICRVHMQGFSQASDKHVHLIDLANI